MLDPGKLTSVDENGDRLNLIPAEVRGFYRRHRDWSQIVLLIIFLVLPWTRINGLQTIHLDIPDREFTLFGAIFRAHDVPLLFFILAIAALGLAFVTSIWGRIWCGWACPQTVFIEAVFRRIEIWVEGNYLARRKLREQEWDFTKLRKVSLKWFLFLFASALIAHSFMAYFVGAESLLAMMQQPPSNNTTYFVLTVLFTSAILFDFAWFREQFCVIMCPYGRIQSVLLDNKSLAVVYDVARGEPRRQPGPANKAAARVGDCVACNRCVQVCPTGIDIRNGLQMECLACTACIDACDEIMTKVNKPKGLIRYDTLDGSRISLKKPRSILYMLAILGLALTFSVLLSQRSSIHWTLLRGIGLPYSQITEGSESFILNQYRIHIQNQTREVGRYKMTLLDLPADATYNVAENPVTLQPKEFREWYFFVRVPKAHFPSSGQIKARIQIQNLGEKDVEEKDLTVLGPRQ